MPRGIIYWEPSKPDLGQPNWTPRQRQELITGFLVFITCPDFEKRFEGLQGPHKEFWRAIAHRTFGNGTSDQAKLNDKYCRDEFFRLKAKYKAISEANEDNAELMGEGEGAGWSKMMKDLGVIEGLGWGGVYGLTEQELQEQKREVEIQREDGDEDSMDGIETENGHQGEDDDSDALTSLSSTPQPSGAMEGVETEDGYQNEHDSSDTVSQPNVATPIGSRPSGSNPEGGSPSRGTPSAGQQIGQQPSGQSINPSQGPVPGQQPFNPFLGFERLHVLADAAAGMPRARPSTATPTLATSSNVDQSSINAQGHSGPSGGVPVQVRPLDITNAGRDPLVPHIPLMGAINQHLGHQSNLNPSIDNGQPRGGAFGDLNAGQRQPPQMNLFAQIDANTFGAFGPVVPAPNQAAAASQVQAHDHGFGGYRPFMGTPDQAGPSNLAPFNGNGQPRAGLFNTGASFATGRSDFAPFNGNGQSFGGPRTGTQSQIAPSNGGPPPNGNSHFLGGDPARQTANQVSNRSAFPSPYDDIPRRRESSIPPVAFGALGSPFQPAVQSPSGNSLGARPGSNSAILQPQPSAFQLPTPSSQGFQPQNTFQPPNQFQRQPNPFPQELPALNLYQPPNQFQRQPNPFPQELPTLNLYQPPNGFQRQPNGLPQFQAPPDGFQNPPLFNPANNLPAFPVPHSQQPVYHNQADRGPIMYNMISQTLADPLLTEQGRITWMAVLEDREMKARCPDLVQSYGLMCERAGSRVRREWVERQIREWMEMRYDERRGLDVRGCFAEGA